VQVLRFAQDDDFLMSDTSTAATSWRIRGRVLALDRPVVMGIVNVTPDSFSDGGRFFSVDAAVEHARRLCAEGADVLDIGGESTRPQGAQPVDAAEERRRVVPVVEALVQALPNVPLSVDTVKAEVARAALDAGAHIVNDVSGFRLDPRMREICAESGAGVVLMHSRGAVAEVGTFAFATYGDVVHDVFVELRGCVAAAEAGGVHSACIAVDPGLGFAKRSEHSLAMLASVSALAAWGYPVVVGASRKRFIGEITGVKEASERVHGTVGANVIAFTDGARIFRVHDVAPTRQALDVAWAVLNSRRSNAGTPIAGEVL
jgi:dihydropteroate synthase